MPRQFFGVISTLTLDFRWKPIKVFAHFHADYENEALVQLDRPMETYAINEQMF